MIRRPPRSTQSRSSAASDVYKRQLEGRLPLESDTAFHRALGTASRNEVLSQTLNTVLGLMSQRRQELLNSDYGGLLMLHQHVHIFRAVKNRDPKAASELISAHLRELAAPHRPLSLI